MHLKSLLHIILTLFTLNAYSQQVTVLECSGKTEVAASSEKNFHKDAYSEIDETELLITINNDKLTVDNHEFEKIESNWEKDGDYDIRGYFITKDQYYEGFYSLEANEPGDTEKNYHIYIRRLISVNRLSGKFNYYFGVYDRNFKKHWLGKLAKTALSKGYLHMEVNGTCRRSAKTQLL